MAKKHLSPKLLQVRDNLPCANCTKTFKGSDSQAFHHYYEKTDVYCSPECKSEGMGKKISKLRAKPMQEFQCLNCEKTFHSKDARAYCSLSCWLDSPQFEAMLRENSEKGRKVFQQNCLDKRPICPVCEINPVKPGRTYCSKKCYRQHLADLFDKQIANPSTLEELQGFDEWLSQENLPCLVEGCDWSGKHLSVHLNRTHGILAADFKRAVGFNLKTGLVAPDKKRHMVETHEHLGMSKEDFLLKVSDKQSGESRRRYVSKESKEHKAKAWALRMIRLREEGKE